MTIKHQKKTYTKQIDYNGEKADLIVTVRHDDECGNGHNTFTIAGDIYKRGRRTDSAFLAGGCIHDEIAKHFPELAPRIKWHLCSTDGPLHYVANSLYHARTTSHAGKNVGDPVAFTTRLKFDGIPFTFAEQAKGFWDYLDNVGDYNGIEVQPIPYDGDSSYNFDPKYSFTGFLKDNQVKRWYAAPFGEKREAEEFLAALRGRDYTYEKTPTAWATAVEPDLNAARNSAIWPEAELSDFTRESLESRLPNLLVDFQQAVESLGLTY